MSKSYSMIKYLFALPCLFLYFSNVYGQAVCYPQTSQSGVPNINPTTCNISADDPNEVISDGTFGELYVDVRGTK